MQGKEVRLRKILATFFSVAILLAIALPPPALAHHEEMTEKGAAIQTQAIDEEGSFLAITASITAACTYEKGVFVCTAERPRSEGIAIDSYAYLRRQDSGNLIGNFGRVSRAELVFASANGLSGKSIGPAIAQRRIGSGDIVLARTFTDPIEA
ncbi:MAG: hypothetical protein UW95_C0004G0038 [Parcubacteria group bacterium GW2011_GWC1_45_14]|nr:MAG: hypothetical protein UW95_C0004G0038 [Parcubacteria group bacterium GW2011_GWC1_45_14]